MRTANRALLAGLCLCVPLLPAQNNTVPASLAGIEGGGGSSIPFGLATPVHLLYLYDGEELPWSGPRVLSGISLRADNPAPGTTAYAAIQYVTMTVFVSTSTRKAADTASRFADNHGTDLTMVVQNLRMQLPAQPAQTGVRAATIQIPFASPWLYAGTPVHQQNPVPSSLVVEIIIQSQPGPATGQQYRLDAVGSCSSQVQFFGNGANCLANRNGGAAGNVVTLAPAASMLAGSTFQYQVVGTPPNAVFSLFFAMTRQGTLFGQPLPYALFDPANPLQPPPGSPLPWSAPDCWINLPMVHALIGTADTTGAGTVSLAIPSGRQFVGLTLHAQAIVFDQTANPLQVVTTLGASATVCGPLGVSRVYQAYPLNGTIPVTGSVSVGTAAVLEVW